MSNWKEKAGFLKPTHITHPVNDVNCRFYPISITSLFELKEAGSGIASALGALFSTTKNDFGQKTVKQTDGSFVKEDYTLDPITPELAQKRSEMQSDGIQKAYDAVVNDKLRDSLAGMVMGSMRENFPNRSEWPPTAEFLAETDVPTFMQMLVGLYKANQGVLAPFLGKLTVVMNSLITIAKKKIDTANMDADGNLTNDPPPSPPNQPTPGELSKINSSSFVNTADSIPSTSPTSPSPTSVASTIPASV